MSKNIFSIYRSLLISFFLFVSASGYADDLGTPIVNIDSQSEIVDLGLKGKQLGHVQTTYRIPLILQEAPITASIEMSFVVLTTGICPTSYFPTEVFLNDESIAEIDFRELDEGSKHALTISLPSKYQRQGNNEIKIITGDCNEGLDSLRFNNVGLLIEKLS